MFNNISYNFILIACISESLHYNIHLDTSLSTYIIIIFSYTHVFVFFTQF